MQHCLFAFDFDGTIAQTFEKSPKGVGVNEAYQQAISQLFGQKALDGYQKSGGLRNRAPSEVVADLVPGLSWEELSTQAEALVQAKLTVLMAEIGTTFSDGQSWPRPCKGFLEFWRRIQQINAEGKVRIDTAIISSGHEGFIRKTFDSWELSAPDILVSDDDVRNRRFPKELTRKVKPGQLPLALAHYRWLRKLGIPSRDENLLVAAQETRNRMIYFGDDPGKDGQLAERGGIFFGLFDESQNKPVGENQFKFSDWREIITILGENELQLTEGTPMAELFKSEQTVLERVKRNGERE